MTTDERDAIAAGLLELARERGELCTFTDHLSSSVDVYVLPDPGMNATAVDGPGGEVTFTVTIPRQTGFPTTNGFRATGKLAFPKTSGANYEVRAVEHDMPLAGAPWVRLTLGRSGRQQWLG